MALSLNQVATNEASVTFPYAGDTLTIVYYPSRISDKMLRSLSKVRAEGDVHEILDGIGSLNEVLSKIVKSWDLYKDDEQTIMWPLDADSLSELPVVFKQDVFMEISKDMSPKQPAA